jgi:hypothetical protein
MFRFRQQFVASFFLAAFLPACFCQTPATFKTQSYTQRLSHSPYAVDVNNDGVPDLVQFLPSTNASRANSTVSFTVRVANGDGSFRAPVVYTLSSSVQVPISPINWAVFGDFNGDGKVDLALDPDGSQLRLFVGNGDGAFQAPKLETVPVPPGQKLGSVFVTEDFNGDGKLDLVTNTFSADQTSGNTTSALYLIPGDGKGNFGGPILIYTSPAGHFVDTSSLAAGHFDSDSLVDVAFLDGYGCDEGNCYSALHVLYNNGGSRFADTSLVSFAGEFFFSAGDLNSDGLTDIFGVGGAEHDELEVLYSQGDRTFHAYNMAIPPQTARVYMADFNGDTRMDLVGAPSGVGTNEQLLFFLAESDEGTFTEQYAALPTLGGVNALVVGDFNFDTKPDVLAVMAYTTTASVIADDLNTTAGGNWGGCAYPRAGQGIRICAPGSSTASPVRFNASANSFGQLRKMELWVDGKKIAEQHHTWGPRAWFNFSNTLASGSHRGVMFAADIDNHLQATVFNFTVGAAACSAPTSAGVHICAPTSGSTVSSPVQVQAAATVTGTLANMQLWVDGVKKYTVSGSKTLNTSVSLAAGTHRFAVVVTNTSGQKWQSAVSANVK